MALDQAGVEVVEVPPQMTAGGRRRQRNAAKTDTLDSVAVARVALCESHLPPICRDGPVEDLRVRVRYRRELIGERHRTANRLHSDFEQLHPGYQQRIGNFVVYSDAASLEARREVAAVAEEMWAELIDEPAIEPGMLRYPEGRHEIDIYAYHDHDPQDWGSRAYHAGSVVWSPDHEQRQTGFNRLSPVVKHELVHVVQWLITGGEGRPVDTWFIDGSPWRWPAILQSSGGSISWSD